MTITQFARVLSKHWLLALAPFVLCVIATFVVSKQTTPVYTASASSYFTLPFGQSGTDLFQGSNYTQQQLASYAQLATKPIVLEPVIDDLGLDMKPTELARQVRASAAPDSVIINIAATDPDPQRAADIANAITGEIGRVASKLAPSLSNGDAAITASTIAKATAPSSPSAPNTKRNILGGALAGVFLGVLLALAREVLDHRVRSFEDLPDGIPVLATLEKTSASAPSVARSRVDHSEFVFDESLRKLQTSLRFLDVEKPVKVIALTSSIPGEGKTSLSIQFARVLSEGSRRVLLIDADLRRPQVASRLALEAGIGLSDVLAGSVQVEEVTQRALQDGLDVLSCGSAVPNPAELLASHAMESLLEELRGKYEYILIDAPPLLPVADASILSSQADGVLMVARYGKVTRSQITSALEQLHRVDARVLGTVINAVPKPSRRRDGRAAYYYDSREQDAV